VRRERAATSDARPRRVTRHRQLPGLRSQPAHGRLSVCVRYSHQRTLIIESCYALGIQACTVQASRHLRGSEFIEACAACPTSTCQPLSRHLTVAISSRRAAVALARSVEQVSLPSGWRAHRGKPSASASVRCGLAAVRVTSSSRDDDLLHSHTAPLAVSPSSYGEFIEVGHNPAHGRLPRPRRLRRRVHRGAQQLTVEQFRASLAAFTGANSSRHLIDR
jgi:hypothetical protein